MTSEEIMNIALKTNALEKEFTTMILNMMREGDMTEEEIDLAGKINQHFKDMIPLMLELKARMN